MLRSIKRKVKKGNGCSQFLSKILRNVVPSLSFRLKLSVSKRLRQRACWTIPREIEGSPDPFSINSKRMLLSSHRENGKLVPGTHIFYQESFFFVLHYSRSICKWIMHFRWPDSWKWGWYAIICCSQKRRYHSKAFHLHSGSGRRG